MTNRGAGGTRSYDVAKHMVASGHEVHMICGIYDVSGLAPMPWYQWFRREVMDGIQVTVCNAPYSNHFGGIKRLWSFLGFGVLATISCLRVGRVDLVFATSTPLTVAIPGMLGASLKRVPFVFEVRDIMPEAYVESGAMKPGLSVWLAERLEAKAYKSARRILLVSPGFEKRLKDRGLPPEKLKTICLGADGNLFIDAEPDEQFIKDHGLEGKTVAIFTGAHGRANGLYYVLDAAEQTKDRDDIRYVLIGEGREKPNLQQQAKERGLTNVVFADAVPKERLVGILAASHIGLMILRYYGKPRPVLPNKIFDYMFMGMPTLVNFRGPTADLVEKHRCGVLVDPEKPEEMAEQVKLLADDPEKRKELGERAKEVAWRRFDRKVIADELADTFAEVVGNVRGAADEESD